jgi:hypothetical protein
MRVYGEVKVEFHLFLKSALDNLLNKKLGEANPSGNFGGKTNLFPPPEIKPQFLGRQFRNPVTMTTLFQLLYYRIKCFACRQIRQYTEVPGDRNIAGFGAQEGATQAKDCEQWRTEI